MQLDSFNCVLCGHLVEETVVHLFADCSFARMWWDLIGIDIPHIAVSQNFSLSSKTSSTLSFSWKQSYFCVGLFGQQGTTSFSEE